MGYKKRGYNRDTPIDLVRYYKLFAIACEGGKREPAYFNIFQYMSSKIKVDVIENYVNDEELLNKHENKSAPKWVLDKAIKYIEKNDLKDEDDLWFVIDKDRWSDEQIRELATYCDKYKNWHLVISNPCFEVWLYLHMKNDINTSSSKSCNDFKNEISKFVSGGYHPYKFIPNIKTAIKNAKTSDKNLKHFLPDLKQTRVHQLGEALLNKVSANEFDHFINITLKSLINIEVEKMTKVKKIAVAKKPSKPKKLSKNKH